MKLAKMFSNITAPSESTLPSIRKKAAARDRLATTKTSRLSSRSTQTPEIGERRTAGTRKLKKRRLSAEVELLLSATRTVSPYRTTLPPICVRSWAIQRRRKAPFRSTPTSGGCWKSGISFLICDSLTLPPCSASYGAPGRNRTDDARLRTAALYPLSYGGPSRW